MARKMRRMHQKRTKERPPKHSIKVQTLTVQTGSAIKHKRQVPASLLDVVSSKSANHHFCGASLQVRPELRQSHNRHDFFNYADDPTGRLLDCRQREQRFCCTHLAC